MSEQTPYEEPEWPTHCELCQEPLESRVVDIVQGEGDQEVPAVVAQDVCTNEDCRASSERATAARHGENAEEAAPAVGGNGL